MMTIEATHTMETNDADLVAESRDGSREAFRQIVERYQTLICSLAYSATGNVSQSEDVAQETFLTAWTDLRSLREPNKLRAWLCGIARNRIHKSLKREGREPAHDAELLETVHDLPAQEAIPSEQTISREEEAILWRSLERIPELYREPIILFYREHQSIESVAAELDLSEDAVKQRLSRGRKLLQEEVQAFVESALSRTAPSQAFASAVLAALPAAPAAVGVGMAGKGAAAAKSGFLAAWLVPMIGILSGIVAGWLIVRSAPTARERRAKMIAIWGMWIFALAWCVPGQLAVRALGKYYQWSDLTLFDTMVGFWWLYTVIIATLIIVMFRQIPGQPPTERGRSRGFADIWNATDVGDAHYRGCRHISIVFFVADHTGVAGARLDIGRNLCRGDGGARYLSFLPVPWPECRSGGNAGRHKVSDFGFWRDCADIELALGCVDGAPV